MDARGAQPQAPWILYFDGATRDTIGNPAGIGVVLKNSRGHTMVELKKLINPGVPSGVAKYKALIAGLKRALSLGVEYMLVKGDSRLVHSQVVGHCSVQDDSLVEYQRKVMALAKDFRALFLERISKEENMRADQLAHDAIDEEAHVVDTLSESIDREWSSNNSVAHTHTHKHPLHHHHHKHPLPLPAPPHLKVKPVALVTPYVVKRHIELAEDSPTSVEEGHLSQHVQAAAKSTRRSRLFSSSTSPPLWPPRLDYSLEDVSPQPEGADSSGSAGTEARLETISSTSEETSGDELSEADYERLVKTLFKGFFQKKKRN